MARDVEGVGAGGEEVPRGQEQLVQELAVFGAGGGGEVGGGDVTGAAMDDEAWYEWPGWGWWE